MKKFEFIKSGRNSHYRVLESDDPIKSVGRWTFYTDGSYNVKEDLGGWGLYIISDAGREWYMSAPISKPTSRQIDGEFCAAMKAVQFAMMNDIPMADCTLVVDLKSVKSYADGDWKLRLKQPFQSLANSLDVEYETLNPNKLPIQKYGPWVRYFGKMGGTVEWVQSHTGIRGNEIADKLAGVSCR